MDVEPAASSDFCPQSVSGLLCLHPAKEGGLSSWASSFAAYNEMTRLYPELAKVGVKVKELLSLDANHCQGGGDTGISPEAKLGTDVSSCLSLNTVFILSPPYFWY